MRLTKPTNQQSLIAFFFIASLILCCWIYLPGLHSNFLLDDEANLQQLKTIQTNPELQSTLLFVFQGNAGLLGRPISLLSFALQAHSWPADPYSFKYVNLMIHLLTGCLVFIFLTQIIKLLKFKTSYCRYLPSLITLIWLIHPMQVSTVLYTVQRMAQLSAFFTLLGLIFYLKARLLLNREKTIPAYCYAFIGIAVCGLLAIFSKENGALLILFILVLEYTILNSMPRSRLWNICLTIFIVLPILIGLIFLIIKFDQLIGLNYQERPFTLFERLITEARILIQYVSHLFIIKPDSYGLYHDDIIVSTSVFKPFTGILSVITLMAFFYIALRFRKTYPLVSFSILWYFAAHSMESSIFPLELYFEHRNYIALIGPFILLILGLAYMVQQIKSASLKPVFYLCIIAWFSLSVAISYNESKLWSQPTIQAEIWAKEKPNSIRAQFAIAMTWLIERKYNKVNTTLRAIHEKHPNHTGTIVSLIYFSCIDRAISPYSIDELLIKLTYAKQSKGFLYFASDLVNNKIAGRCTNVSDQHIEKMFSILLANPTLKSKHSFIHLFRGQFHLHQKKYLSALNDFEKSYALTPKVPVALLLTHTCELLKNKKCALRGLRMAYNSSQKRYWDKISYAKVIDSIRTRIEQTAGNW